MDALNAFCTSVTDRLFAPLAELPLANLIVWAAVTGVALTVAFRYLSNQRKMACAVDSISAQLLAVRLFKHDPLVALRCQGRIFVCVGQRLWLWLPAIAVMSIPSTILMAQFAARYERRPLMPDEEVVVELQMRADSWNDAAHVQLELPPSVLAESPAVPDKVASRIAWRVRPTSAGDAILTWRFSHIQVTGQLTVAADTDRLAVAPGRRAGSGFWDALLYPAFPGIPAEVPAVAIHTHYPERSTPILGWDIPWWVTFLVVSMIAAMMVRPWFRVRF